MDRGARGIVNVGSARGYRRSFSSSYFWFRRLPPGAREGLHLLRYRKRSRATTPPRRGDGVASARRDDVRSGEAAGTPPADDTVPHHGDQRTGGGRPGRARRRRRRGIRPSPRPTTPRNPYRRFRQRPKPAAAPLPVPASAPKDSPAALSGLGEEPEELVYRVDFLASPWGTRASGTRKGLHRREAGVPPERARVDVGALSFIYRSTTRSTTISTRRRSADPAGVHAYEREKDDVALYTRRRKDHVPVPADGRSGRR